MSQQNPFASQDLPPPEADIQRSSVQPTLQASALPVGLPGFGFKKKAWDQTLDWRVSSQPESLTDKLAQSVVLFPRTSKVVSNEAGVFVPRRLFGDAEVHHRQELSIRRLVTIVVFSAPAAGNRNFRRVDVPMDCNAELRWLAENRNEYAGRWVALNGEELISSGTDGSEVYQNARKKGFSQPFLVLVEDDNDLPFAGW